MDPQPIDLQSLITFLAERAALEQLSFTAVEYIADRLNEKGMYPKLNNFGGIRCIHPHNHDDGTCSLVGPLFERSYIRVYESAEDGLADLIRISHHATLSGQINPQFSSEEDSNLGDGIKTCFYCGGPYCVAKCGDLPCCYCGKPWKGPKSETNMSGYRSIEQTANSSSEFVESFVDRLDGDVNGVISDIQDKIVKSTVLSFCRGTVSDEKKIDILKKKGLYKETEEEKKVGFFEKVKNNVVRSAVVSFCTGQISADAKIEKAENTTKLSGIENECRQRIEEIAAQWSTIKKIIDKDPTVNELLSDSFNHWMKVWGDYTSGRICLDCSDIQRLIYEVNMARSVLVSKDSIGSWADFIRKKFDPPSDETIARVAELAEKYNKLKKWGIDKKLPFMKETIAVTDRFFEKARGGEVDVAEVTSVTSDIRKLEKYAEEYDVEKKVKEPFKQEKLKTSFDIENASEGLKVAAKLPDIESKLNSISKPATWKIIAASALGTLALVTAVKVAL